MISQRIIDLLHNHNVPDIDFLEHYIAFINKAYSRIPEADQYQEIHHIFPRCWGCDNNEDNLICLSKRDHLIAHKLLALTKDAQMYQGFLVTFNGCDPYNLTKEDVKFNEYAKLQISKPVVNLNTGKIYGSARLACRDLGLSKSSVSLAIKSHRRAGGYYWALKSDVEQYSIETLLAQYQQERQQKSRERKVINLNTRQVFNTCALAAKSINNKSKRSIITAITQKCKAGGYYWQYYDIVLEKGVKQCLFEYKQSIRRNHRGRRIVETDSGVVYNSIRELADALGVAFCTVSNALKHSHRIRGKIYKEIKDNEFDGAFAESQQN